jgi:hypothetical protein
VTAPTDDEQTVGQVAAVAKLYVGAVLDEVRQATRLYEMELDRIRRKYAAELSSGDEQFALLLACADRWGVTS